MCDRVEPGRAVRYRSERDAPASCRRPRVEGAVSRNNPSVNSVRRNNWRSRKPTSDGRPPFRLAVCFPAVCVRMKLSAWAPQPIRRSIERLQANQCRRFQGGAVPALRPAIDRHASSGVQMHRPCCLDPVTPPCRTVSYEIRCAPHEVDTSNAADRIVYGQKIHYSGRFDVLGDYRLRVSGFSGQHPPSSECASIGPLRSARDQALPPQIELGRTNPRFSSRKQNPVIRARVRTLGTDSRYVAMTAVAHPKIRAQAFWARRLLVLLA